MKAFVYSIIRENKSRLWAFGLIFFLASCGFDRYNAVTEDTPDVREGNEYVYGDGEEAPPRQAANEYPNTPESEKRAQDLREKMFGKGKAGDSPSTPVMDTAQPTADSTEAGPAQDSTAQQEENGEQS